MAIRRRVPVLPGLLLFITSIAAGQGAHFQNAGGEHTGQKTGVGLLIERPRGIPDGVTSRVAAFAVTSNVDSGEGTLRKAIKDANASGAPATITFDLPAGARTIQPLSFLPQIRVPVTIDGTTQSGYSGTPIVELNGTFAGLSDGLELFGGNSTIRGLAINGFFGTGIFFDSLGGNVVEGCYIGLNTAGDHAIPNGGNGVYILECAGNRIGGYAPAARNVISSNFKPQVIISDTASHDNLVIGNYIGTDATGLNVMGNDSSDGVVIGWGAYRNMIGGSLPGARNLISGHPWEGVFIRNPGTSQNVVAGNWIGLDGTGYYRLGNGIGVWISEGASDNIIGGHAVLERNAITFNDSAGIIIDRSFGPTLPTDTFTTTRNQVLGNGLGVNSQWLGVTNGDGIGILVRDAPGNIIGVPEVMNFITNCISHGIVIRGTDARGTIIQGNYIAKSPIANVVYFGQDPLLSGSGIVIDDAPGTLIGGPLPGARNYIGAVGGDAIAVIGPHATGTVIQNNVIGTDATLLENWHAFGNGVFIAADSTTVGGETSDLGNVIAYCKGAGIYDSTGSHNLFRNNSLFENVSYGIDLAPHGITPNDSLDADIGANERQNFPIIDSVAYSPTSMHVRGKLNAHPNADYDIDFFVSPTRHASHFGEGKTLIGSARVTTDGAGFVDLNLDLFTAVQRTDFITATATEVSTRNTSEFSRAINDLDTDNDGILDIWESENDGIDVNCDGIIDLNLYDLGASPNHKDLFVEVDAMQGYSPAAEVLRELRIAFNSSPVVNPDRTTGIHLHIDVSDSTLTPVDWIVEPRAWPGVEFLTSKRAYFGNTADRIDPNARWILQAKDLVYRYALCVKSISPNAYSGVANVIPGNPGNEFIVSLGQWAGGGTPYEWMGTFMHELGHTLGLQHGGGDSVVYKPTTIAS